MSHDRLRGIRIFEISDIANPKYLANVQTCRGSHTHTVVTDPKDPANVYIYVSGSAPVRSPKELPGCSDAPLDQDPNTALFRADATFCSRVGLSGGGVSLQSYNFPGYYIRHYNAEVWMSNGAGAAGTPQGPASWAADSTWSVAPPWTP